MLDTNRERRENFSEGKNAQYVSLQKVKLNCPCQHHEGVWGVEILLHSL